MAKKKYSRELAIKIAEMVANKGATVKLACGVNGITEAVFYVWKNKDHPKNPLTDEEYVEFVELMSEAEDKRDTWLLNQIHGATSKDWKAGAWLLARHRKNVFGDNAEPEKPMFPIPKNKKEVDLMASLVKKVNEHDKKNTKKNNKKAQDAELGVE